LNFLKSSTAKPQYVVSKDGKTKVPMKAKDVAKKNSTKKETHQRKDSQQEIIMQFFQWHIVVVREILI
jgi:hypothetical protein